MLFTVLRVSIIPPQFAKKNYKVKSAKWTPCDLQFCGIFFVTLQTIAYIDAF
jgi:hypothetical protein